MPWCTCGGHRTTRRSLSFYHVCYWDSTRIIRVGSKNAGHQGKSAFPPWAFYLFRLKASFLCSLLAFGIYVWINPPWLWWSRTSYLCSASPCWCMTFSVLNLYILSWKKMVIQALAYFKTEILELLLSSCFSPWYNLRAAPFKGRDRDYFLPLEVVSWFSYHSRCCAEAFQC